MIISNLLKILSKVSKYQLLTHPAHKISIALYLRIAGKALEILFFPLNFTKKPKEPFGKRLAEFFQELGPIYIKLGQTLSTRPDLIGEDIAYHLKFLQDNLPPFSGDTAKSIIKHELGSDIDELFTSFSELPVAAASISQVHKAYLKDGMAVAIKILRPNIHRRYNNDIQLMYLAARWLNRYSPKLKRLKLVEVVNLFNQTMQCELDLRLEAAAASEMHDNLINDADIYSPKVLWQFTTEKIMTSQWVDGISIYDIPALLANNLDPSEIATKIAVMFFNQAFRDGFFHADLHPGNIMVRNDGTIILVDFGIMGRLPERDRLAVAEILAAFLKRNYKTVAEVHLRAGYVPKNTNVELFAQSCRAVAEPIIGLPLNQISIGKLLAQLFKVTEDFGMETQPQLLLLQKTMVVVEGIGKSLNPALNMWELAEPWIKIWAAKNLSFEARILRLVKKITKQILEKLPEQL